MTLPTYRSSDPLYIIYNRDQDARNQFARWLSSSKSIQARIDDNRLHIYDQNTFSMFLVTWNSSWALITIWDNWVRRHIHI